MAFLVCVDFRGESGVRKVVLGGIHPLTRRYVTGEINGTQIFKFKRSRISAKSR
ncbi:TPA: DUF3265 domain-containing protein [Vibrio vulnificus]|nr:DUF3265 domain-containing protein [Vibrio vulnificus]